MTRGLQRRTERPGASRGSIAAAALPALLAGCGGSARTESSVEFDPAYVDATDLAVGEVRSYEIAFRVRGPAPGLRLSSSCECLGVELWDLTPDGRGRARAELIGIKEERIEGIIGAFDGQKRLGEHVVRIDIRRKPFVAPRTIALAPGERSGEFVAGQAFAKDAQPELLLLHDFQDGGLILRDIVGDTELTPDHLLMRDRVQFEVPEEAALPAEFHLRLQYGEPPQWFAVTVAAAPASR